MIFIGFLYKLDYVINECNKRGFDLEEDIYYDDDD